MSIHRYLLASSLLATTLAALPIAGLAAVDPSPNGCVSCHVLDQAKGVDARLSVLLKEWTAGKIEPGLLAQSKASSPAGLTLKGKHPACCTSSTSPAGSTIRT